MSHFQCSNCGHVSVDDFYGNHDIGKIETLSDSEVIGSIPFSGSIMRASDEGVPLVLTCPNHVITKAFETITEAILQKYQTTLSSATT